MTTVLAMQAHAEALCAKHEIIWNKGNRGSRRAWGAYEIREILTPPILGPVSYAVLLHEIGHILGQHQTSKRVMIREQWAWAWAHRNALCWTPAMQRCRVNCLRWYEANAERLDRKRATEG